MHFSLSSLFISVMGTAAFSSGLHNVISHPELGFALGTGTLTLGMALLGIVGVEIRGKYKTLQAAKLEADHSAGEA